jgi:hypothetical protein
MQRDTRKRRGKDAEIASELKQMDDAYGKRSDERDDYVKALNGVRGRPTKWTLPESKEQIGAVRYMAQRLLDGEDFRIVSYIIDYAPKAFPRIATLAREAGRSERKVQMAIAEAKRIGLLQVHYRKSNTGTGGNMSNVFEFRWRPAWEAMQRLKKHRGAPPAHALAVWKQVCADAGITVHDKPWKPSRGKKQGEQFDRTRVNSDAPIKTAAAQCRRQQAVAGTITSCLRPPSSASPPHLVSEEAPACFARSAPCGRQEGSAGKRTAGEPSSDPKGPLPQTDFLAGVFFSTAGDDAPADLIEEMDL